MAIDFPDSPASGDIYTVGGKQWQWDGEKWKAYGATLAPSILKIDSANNRVGINDTSPSYSLDVNGTCRITGDLTIQGTTTTIDSTTLTVDDKNIELGSVATPSDTTADGGGITLKGATDKTILWTNSTDTWDFNQGVTVTGTVTATAFAGDLTGDVTGDVTGNADTATTAGTVTTAAQTAITSVGTLTGLTVDSAGKFIHYTNFRSYTGTNTDTGLGDAAEIILMDNAAANTYNIVANSTIAHPIGTSIMFFQQGAGQTWIKPTGSTVIRSKDSNQKLAAQYSSAVATKIATDEWILVGDLAS